MAGRRELVIPKACPIGCGEMSFLHKSWRAKKHFLDATGISA